MTVSGSTNKVIHNGNGTTTSWPFSFKVFDPAHLVVTCTDALGVDTTLSSGAYTVSLNADQDNDEGGTVGYSPALAAGSKLTILRGVPYTQDTDIKNQGGFFPEVLERSLDLLVMQVQQVREQMARALKLSPSQAAIGELEATDANRANTFLGFGPSGLLSLFTGVASQAVSLAMQPVVSAASLAAARSALGSPDEAGFTLKGRRVGTASGAPDNLTAAQAMAGLLSIGAPGHRLTLTSGTPVTTADVAAASAIHLEPYRHNMLAILDGAGLWTPYAMGATSFALSSTYHLANKNYDLFVENTTGAPRLGTSPAWTNDTTRADALSRTAGRDVNAAQITLRFGTGAADTVSVPAGRAVYLGTFRCAANGQTEDSAARRFVWNNFNRTRRFMRVIEQTDSWTYSLGTIRQVRAIASNQLDLVRGVDEEAVLARAVCSWNNDTIGTIGRTLIGLDSTTSKADGCLTLIGTMQNANHTMPSQAWWSGFPGLGYHRLVWLEMGAGAGTTNWNGDGGSHQDTQSGIEAEAWG